MTEKTSRHRSGHAIFARRRRFFRLQKNEFSSARKDDIIRNISGAPRRPITCKERKTCLKSFWRPVRSSARTAFAAIWLTYLMNDLLNAVDRDVIGLQVGVELSYLTVPEQEMVEEVHESTGKYPSLEQAKKIRQHREEKTLTKEIVRLLVIGERKKKTTVTLKQDEIKKYFPPEYDEQKIRTVICQLLEEWSNQNH